MIINISTILITVIFIIVLYYVYIYHLKGKLSESFDDNYSAKYNSRIVSNENAKRVKMPLSWRAIHKVETDIHPVEF